MWEMAGAIYGDAVPYVQKLLVSPTHLLHQALGILKDNIDHALVRCRRFNLAQSRGSDEDRL